MMKKWKTICIVLTLAAGSAYASPIGVLGLGSSGTVTATLTSLFWTADPAAIPSGGPWNADVNSATTLSFAGGPLVTQEGVLINQGHAFGTPPPPGAGVFNPFMTFALHPNLQFFDSGVMAGSANTNCAAANATGLSCSIAVGATPSPVVLTDLGTSTLVSIGLFGTATDGTGNSSWSGAFSATIPNITPEGILLFFCPSGTCTAADAARGTVLEVRSVSGSFNATAVPEPGTITLSLAGVALMLVGVARRKRTS